MTHKPARAKQVTTQYALAVLAAVAALLLRKLLNPFLGDQNPYLTMWLAVVFSAWYCGVGPSILAVLMGATGVWYFFLPPFQSWAIQGRTELYGALGFIIFGTVIIALGESSRRIIRRLETAEENLSKTQEELKVLIKNGAAALEAKMAETIEQATLLNLANDAILVKQAGGGTISYWNQGAERLYGWTKEEALGHSPHELLQTEFPVPLQQIESPDNWEGELRHTKRDGTKIVVASRWTTVRDTNGNPLGWLEINTDITFRKQVEAAARQLSGKLLKLQDEERRRIARGLHDSLGQYLAALKMNLAALASNENAVAQANVVAESRQIVDKCLTETRTISYLLHPPLLDEAGLGSAARWYVEGFVERSGIKINLELPPELGRVHKDIETALFRALQEGLTNVHRHSGCSTVEIRLDMRDKRMRLEIRDNGHGMPQKTLNRILAGVPVSGVGIAGMRERVRELGGSLNISSDSSGTLVDISIPLFDADDKNNDKKSGPTAA